MLSFQNCGDTGRNSNFLNLAEESINQNSACPNGNCGSDADNLWMQIREYDPYRIQFTTLSQGFFSVGGICGTGNFSNHSFLWVLQESFGAQDIVGQGFSDNLCDSGKFVLPVVPNRKPMVPDSLYTLEVELVGVTESLQQVSNPMPSNVGVLDIILTTQP